MSEKLGSGVVTTTNYIDVGNGFRTCNFYCDDWREDKSPLNDTPLLVAYVDGKQKRAIQLSMVVSIEYCEKNDISSGDIFIND
jgi:hypothetical protein